MKEHKLTPTEELILEVLSARVRLGENIWTFSSKLKSSILRLEARNLVSRKPGVVEHTELVWLTDDGYLLCFAGSKRYSPPVSGAKFDKLQKRISKKAKKLRKKDEQLAAKKSKAQEEE